MILPPGDSREHLDRAGERGSVLVWALIFVVLTSGMVVSHSISLASNRREFDNLLDRKVLAHTVAQSGVVDGLAWFRGQPVQPVQQFDPVHEPHGDPPRFDTLDASLGLVREFEIRGNLWGRYELRREEAVDVTQANGGTGTGKTWAMMARAYVYRIADPRRPFDEAPNRIVAVDTMSTQFGSLGMSLPAPAALVTQDPEMLFVGRNVIINGAGGPAVAHGDGPTDVKDYADPGTKPTPENVEFMPAVPPVPIKVSPDPIVNPLALLTGTPTILRQTTLAVDVSRLFGVPAAELRSFADVIATDATEIGKLATSGRLVFVPGDLYVMTPIDIDGAVVVVHGNFALPTLAETSHIRGILYIEGDAKIQGNVKIDGSLIVRHTLALGDSSGGPPVEITYDPAMIEAMQRSMSKYRLKRGSL